MCKYTIRSSMSLYLHTAQYPQLSISQLTALLWLPWGYVQLPTVAALNVEAMAKIVDAYMNIEDQIRKGYSAYKHSSKLIDSSIKDLTDALPEIMIRHTSESSWFGKHIKKPLPHTDVDMTVPFPSQFTPLLDQLDQIIRQQLQDIKPTPRGHVSPGQVSRVCLSLAVITHGFPMARLVSSPRS